MTEDIDRQIRELEKQLADAKKAREVVVKESRKTGIARLCAIRDEIHRLTKEAEVLARTCDVVFHFDGNYNEVMIVDRENWTGSNCESDY